MKKTTLSLLNFNTLGTIFFAPNITKRYKKIAEEITKRDIDIVHLQEISTYFNLSILKKHMHAYPYCIYKKGVVGPKGGLVIFSKYPIKNIHYYTYNALGSYRNVTFYTKLIRNGILSCDLTDIPLKLMNTHLVTDFNSALSPDNNFYYLVEGQIMETICEVKRAHDKNAVIISGDFNMSPQSPLYKKFRGQTGCIDPFSTKPHDTYYPDRIDYTFKAAASAQIDYIFLAQKTKKFDTIETDYMFEEKVRLDRKHTSYLSDHSGLFIRFSLEG